jgi:LSD1 subclass zinc finger protein
MLSHRNVVCGHCSFQQHIPAEARQYYCGRCKEINDVEPTFGMFICGVCRQKVLYPYKTSDRMHCNICHTINIVYKYPPGYEQELPKDLAQREEEISLQRQMELDEATTAKPEDKELEDL